jgi:nucleoside-diphosphate-sugar epimerase
MQGAPERKNGDATALERDFGFTPKITLREGLRKFAEWYAKFYGTRS